MKSRNFYTGNHITMEQLQKVVDQINDLTGENYVIQRQQGQGVRLGYANSPIVPPLGHEFLSKNIFYFQVWAYRDGIEKGMKLSS